MKSDWASWQVWVSSDVIVHYLSCNCFQVVQMPPPIPQDLTSALQFLVNQMPSHFRPGFFCLSSLYMKLWTPSMWREKSFRDLMLISFLLITVQYQHFPPGKGTNDTFFPCAVGACVCALRLFLLKQSKIYFLWDSMFCCQLIGLCVSVLNPPPPPPGVGMGGWILTRFNLRVSEWCQMNLRTRKEECFENGKWQGNGLSSTNCQVD